MPQTIHIDIYREERLPTRAIVRGALALHRSHYPDHHPAPTYRWTVTHIPTGLALCWTVRCDDARRALRQLAALGGWDFDFADAPTDMDRRIQLAAKPADWRRGLAAIREQYQFPV